jgi:hypothetical protein
MNSVSTPNLKAFAEQVPQTRIGILRALWPTIHDCLTVGHSLREIHKTLHLDGIEMPYSTLCRIVATLQRATLPKVDRVPKQTTAPATPGERSAKPAVVDPLRNLRRLSEHRPGFEYSGTLPDEELFGRR